MDVVYILGTGSVWSDNELRYSLRSIEKNLKNIRNVFIVGSCPDWVQNVIHIPCLDNYQEKWRNGFFKVSQACLDPELSEDFLLMNDDFFILREMDVLNFGYFYNGDLTRIHGGLSTRFLTSKANTARYLREHEKSIRDYALHCPLVLNKALYLGMPISIELQGGFSPRSFYCNYYDVGGKNIKDQLLTPMMTFQQMDQTVKNWDFVSIVSNVARSPVFRRWIHKRFPARSKYELAEIEA